MISRPVVNFLLQSLDQARVYAAVLEGPLICSRRQSTLKFVGGQVWGKLSGGRGEGGREGQITS